MRDSEFTTVLFIYVASMIVALLIIYFVVKAAVFSANRQLLRSTRILCNLKAIELKKAGLTDAEIRKSVELVDELENLKSTFRNTTMSQPEYEKKRSEYMI